MRYKASISYDGSKFYGFQRLKNKLNIQETLEKALTKINKSLVVVKGAGRTDRGVHAYNQMIHFDLNANIPEDRLKNAINSLVEPHIHVNYCEKVDNNFHARFSVITKTYQYVINMGEFDALDDDYLYNYCHKLNIKKMKKASKLLLGFHSYKAFTSGERENYNSIIYKIKFTKKKDILVITFIGKSFYRYMVRNLTGALIKIGEEKADVESIKEMLEKEKNTTGYTTAPSNGLYLVDITY